MRFLDAFDYKSPSKTHHSLERDFHLEHPNGKRWGHSKEVKPKGNSNTQKYYKERLLPVYVKTI